MKAGDALIVFSFGLQTPVHVVIEVRSAHPRLFQHFPHRDLAAAVGTDKTEKSVGIAALGSAEADAVFLRDGDPFRLAGADVRSLVLGDEREDLQDDVGDEFADEILAFRAGVEQGHIEDENVRLQLPRDAAPLFDNHIVVSAEAVDGLDDEEVARLQDFQHTDVGGADKILAAFLVGVDSVFGHTGFAKGGELSFEILVGAGYSGISVGHDVLLFGYR